MFRQKNDSAQSKLPLVKLKNGTEAPEFKVFVVMEVLNFFYQTNMAVFVEFVDQCRNPTNEISVRMKKLWQNFQLMNKDGEIDSEVKHIVISSVSKTVTGFEINSPIDINARFRSKL